MNAKVLIVESNSVFAAQLEIYLRKWGYISTGLCKSGAVAIKTIRQKRPDLIIMDIDLNGLYSGLEVGEKIKDLTIPIIYMTGLEDKKNFQAAIKAENITYLVKPFDMSSLKGIIDFHLEQKNSTPSQKEITNPPQNGLFVKKNKELIKVEPSSIDWINSSANYCIISTNSNRYLVRMSMKQVMELLPKNVFVRIHKSYCINLHAVIGILLVENKVRIGEDLLPIGRHYRKKLLELIRHIR